MSMPALQPLQCIKCQTAILAGTDEVAWLCPTCGQAQLLDEEQPAGLSPIEMQFAKDIQPGQPGRPFWVAQGSVTVERETYSGNEQRQALEFWQAPRNFFVPAYTCSLEQLISLGSQLLKQPFVMTPSPAAPFLPVTLALEDVRPMAEFIIMGVEAERRDMLKSVGVQLNLAAPSLWVLP
jgi:hypothetical protein